MLAIYAISNFPVTTLKKIRIKCNLNNTLYDTTAKVTGSTYQNNASIYV